MCSDTFQGKKIWKIHARCFFLEELQITTLWKGQIKQHKKMPCSLGSEVYVFCLSSITQGCLKAFTRIQIFCALPGWSGTQCMRCCSRAKHWTCCWSCDFPGPNSALRSLGALALCFCTWFIYKSMFTCQDPKTLNHCWWVCPNSEARESAGFIGSEEHCSTNCTSRGQSHFIKMLLCHEK